MWLSLRTSPPICTILDLYLLALNKSDNSAAAHSNRSLYFDLKLHNKMKDKSVHYANISLTFFYYNSTALPIANFTVPAFKQGRSKQNRRKAFVGATGVPWAAAIESVSNGSTVTFRVGLVTRVKYKILFWYTKRHTVAVGCDVAVDESGKKVGKKGIKLRSGAPGSGRSRFRVGLLVVLLVLAFL